MKVAYILTTFLMSSETFILNEILMLQSKGIEIAVFASEKCKFSVIHEEVKKIERVCYFSKKFDFFRCATAHIIFFFKSPKRYFYVFFMALRLRGEYSKLFFKHLERVFMVSKYLPDHIHAHYGIISADLAFLSYLLTGTPFTFTTHRWDIFGIGSSQNYKAKSFLAKAHITISEFNKQYIVENFGVDPGKISVIHTGINFNKEFPSFRMPAILTILTVARLERFKGHDLLIRACAILKKQGVKFQCFIIGFGPERSNLEYLINQEGVSETVILLGERSSVDVFEYLAKSTIFVLASRSEGIPLSLMEAMAMRVPVISTTVTGIPELIEDGKSGFLIPPDDIVTLAQRMKQLLSDEKLRTYFAENGYKKVFEEFNLDVETEKIIRIWRNNCCV